MSRISTNEKVYRIHNPERFIELGGVEAIALSGEDSILAAVVELAASFHCSKSLAIVFHSQKYKPHDHSADFSETLPHIDRRSDTDRSQIHSSHSAETPLHSAFRSYTRTPRAPAAHYFETPLRIDSHSQTNSAQLRSKHLIENFPHIAFRLDR
jgi:hypothetical protein